MKSAIIAVLAVSLLTCAEEDGQIVKGTNPRDAWEPVTFEELTGDTVPPCLSYSGRSFQKVIRDTGDYEELRRDMAPQGKYVDFGANGSQQTFQLPYQPVDVNHNGRIDPNEIIIYVKNNPLYAEVNGDTISIDANPIRMEGDSILIFKDTFPYTIERKVFYQDVFTVDSITGAVTFHMPPPAGSEISLSASRLYDAYKGRTCSMEYFDFTDQIIIGQSVTGNGCLLGLEQNIYLDTHEKRLVCVWQKVISSTEGGCPAIAVQITRWIAVESPHENYDIVFIEDLPVVRPENE